MTDWRERANCRTVGPELFYESEHAAKAESLCDGCEVRPECLQHALDTREPYGIWGGVRAADRATIVGRPRRVYYINHGTQGGYQAHRRRREEPCRECLAAKAEAEERRKWAAS